MLAKAELEAKKNRLELAVFLFAGFGEAESCVSSTGAIQSVIQIGQLK